MTCIYKRTVEAWECTQALAEVVYRESLPESTCQSPIDIISTNLQSGRTLSQILTAGIIMKKPNNYCCPEDGVYYLGGVTIYASTLDAIWEQYGLKTTDMPLSVMAGVEKYLTLTTAMSLDTHPIQDYTANEVTSNCFQTSTNYINLFENGVMEFGSFENFNIACAVLETFSSSDITEIITNGLVIACNDLEIFIGNVGSYATYSEILE